MFLICPLEEFGNMALKWRCYEDVVVGMNDQTREERKRVWEQYKETPSPEFIWCVCLSSLICNYSMS
jgi:hypothetical protein